MAIEISPKKKLGIPTWSIIVLGVCLILLLCLAVSYFYFGAKIKDIFQGIQKKEAEFALLGKTIQEKQKELITLEQKINDFGSLLGEHRNTLNIFEFLEKNCLPNVWFSDFSFSGEEGKISVSGKTDNLITFEQQAFVLKQQSAVKNLDITKVSIGTEKEIGFTFTITFDPVIFK